MIRPRKHMSGHSSSWPSSAAQAHQLFDTHDGPNADTTVMAMMRVIHVFAMGGKCMQVDVACDKAILMVTQASVLTQHAAARRPDRRFGQDQVQAR